MKDISFQLISPGTQAYEEMVALRMTVLLEPVGIPRSYINPQKEAGDLLVGAYGNENLVACCILTRVDKETIQLRQMAVDNRLQGKGVGAMLLHRAEDIATEAGYQSMMLHARHNVLPFYEKCGYQVIGDPFLEVGITHYKMQKEL